MTTVLARQGYDQRVRTAHATHRCYACDGLIVPGERYLWYLATPGHDMNQTGKWLHAAFHRRCSDTAPEWASA